MNWNGHVLIAVPAERCSLKTPTGCAFQKENKFMLNSVGVGVGVGDGPITLSPNTRTDIVDLGQVPLPDLIRTQSGSEDDNRRPNDVEKGKIARKRWQLLAKALRHKNRSACVQGIEGSVRRFRTFNLMQVTPSEDSGGCWFVYSTEIFGTKYCLKIHHLEEKLTPEKLIGYNNTGNICIWPSEEVLAFYLLSNLNLFEGKDLLEVGGGMTCLAGLMLATYGKISRADLTDGNIISVENVRRIIKENKLQTDKVNSFQLDWLNHKVLSRTYDVVLSSDCLFFDQSRPYLLDTIWHSLKDDGLAVVMAPTRGHTLNSFVEMANVRGFHSVLQPYYNDTIWQRHLKFKQTNADYDENLHYPLLLLLRKAVDKL